MDVSKTDRYWTIRVRPADGLDSVGYPDWAQRIARGISTSAAVRLVKPAADGWLVECVRLRRQFTDDRADARETARQIVEEIER
jgi:hypothetical protein